MSGLVRRLQRWSVSDVKMWWTAIYRTEGGGGQWQSTDSAPLSTPSLKRRTTSACPIRRFGPGPRAMSDGQATEQPCGVTRSSRSSRVSGSGRRRCRSSAWRRDWSWLGSDAPGCSSNASGRPPRHKNELGHVLASRSLYTDGAEVIYDFAEWSGDSEADDVRQLVVVRNGQHVFNEVVDRYLRRVEFAGEGYAQLIRLPGDRQPRSSWTVAGPGPGLGPADLRQRWGEGRGCLG